MTPAELLAALAAAGCKLMPDCPERGRIACEPAWPAELKAAAVEHKEALLQHLRAAKDVAALAEVMAGTPDPFAFGNNNPGDPDGEADDLLAFLRGGLMNCAVGVNPDDRTKIRIVPFPTDAALLDKVKRLKPAILAILEREARQEELADKPTPFRDAPVGQGGVVQGGAGSQPDGVDGPPLDSPDRGDAPRGQTEAGDASGGGGEGAAPRGVEDGPVPGAGGAAEPVRLYVGWVKLQTQPKGFTVWQQVASAADRWDCWQQTLKHPVDANCERVVIGEGKTP